MKFVKQLQTSIKLHSKKNAFFINNAAYTYEQFEQSILAIRNTIRKQIPKEEYLVGLVTNDDLETYAGIIALWFEGKGYLPLNPDLPFDRNKHILESTSTKYILDSLSLKEFAATYQVVNTKKRYNKITKLEQLNNVADSLCYILFTSGTTGNPKGVPISYGNLDAFVNAANAETDFELRSNDKCLQMFEVTFDFSVVSFLLPLLAGACVYTIPRNAIKYFYVFKLIKEQELTVLSLVPSMINYLRPYFSEILAPKVRFCSFGGGALYSDITKEWSKCIPNAKILNYYGPTECTIYSSVKLFNDQDDSDFNNGIVSIGKPRENTRYLIVDKNHKKVSLNTEGELCISSPQVTPGYWKNENKNSESFFEIVEQEKVVRFYKTGDLCKKDHSNEYHYLGRVDFQVKIRGFRIELAEVEFYAKKYAPQKVNIVALDVLNKLNNAELALAIESAEEFEIDEMLTHMKNKMPDYMIPRHIKFVREFPLNTNGKIDRVELKSNFVIN